jgi:hypothetical protein
LPSPLIGARAILRPALACFTLATLASAQSGEVRHLFQSSFLDDEFGTAVAGAGDLDGDGRDDLLVGAPFSAEAFPHGGSIKAYSGATGALLFAMNGTGSNHGLGLGLSSAGDVSGDGVPDVLGGMSGNGSTWLGPGGGAKIFSGVDGALIHTFGGTTFNDGFGLAVAGLGDLNGDGRSDVIVGTAFAPGAPHPGYARVFSGLDGSILYSKTGAFNGQRFGVAVGSAGDVDGDGTPDFIIGAIGNNAAGPNSGSAFVYSGANGSLLLSLHGSGANHLFGYSVAGVGDQNGDTFDDVLVGTFIPGGTGYARVHSGATGGILFTLTASTAGDAFGHTVSGAGDVNGDGLPDFCVAAPNSNVGGTLRGFVRLFSGGTGAVLKDVGGPVAGLHFGYGLAPAGDVNGDALDDVIIGTLAESSTGLPGRALVVSNCAAAPYGVGLLPTQTLATFWILGAAGHESEGGVGILGAAPNGPGLIGLSVAPTFFVTYDVPVLFDVTPGLFALFNVTYDGVGYFEAPLNLRNPALAGVSLYAQAFEANLGAPQGFYASNGIVLYFGN